MQTRHKPDGSVRYLPSLSSHPISIFFFLLLLFVSDKLFADANCYTNSDLTGTPLFTYNTADDTYTASTSTQYTAAGTPFESHLATSECFDRNGTWGDPNAPLTATIDANLSFENPQVLNVTSPVEDTGFFMQSCGTAGATCTPESIDTNTHAVWAIETNGRFKISFSTDDAAFTMDDGTQSAGPVFWMKEKDVDGIETNNYESLPTDYTVQVTNISGCNGDVCSDRNPSSRQMSLRDGIAFDSFSRAKGTGTKTSFDYNPVISGEIIARALSWRGSPADLVAADTNGFSNDVGNILVMDELGSSVANSAAGQFVVYETVYYENSGYVDEYKRANVQDNRVFVFVKATPAAGSLSAQPGTYTASVKMTVVSVN